MTQNSDLIEVAFNVMKFFVPFLFSLCFHEFAHGWVAKRRGDRTAELMGRLTLNPTAHADLIGTVILPIASIIMKFPLFGWAIPVPVDERNLKNPRVDMFWIAFAGPLSNLLLAFVGAIALGVLYRVYGAAVLVKGSGLGEVNSVLQMFILLNVYLAVFNMIPLHPLDGGKVLARFLPEDVNRKLEDLQAYSSVLLLVLFLTGLISLILRGPAHGLFDLYFAIAKGVAGS